MSNDYDFCTGDSLMCSKLHSITDDSHEFCKKMGFDVNNKKGYDGVPAAKKNPLDFKSKGSFS
jgi:hypothetical protein